MDAIKSQGAIQTATVNGETVSLFPAMSVSDLLAWRGLTGKRVAVERNGEIVPRSQHADTTLNHGDQVEIVIAVGGG
ncbi:MAG TPA: sulfur carrier protein ThiS [Azonexus sp.]|nr:sulfur carrier protein ThiS [Azonexus sp.]